MSESYGIPLSTLKLNARILKALNLIAFGDGSTVRSTPTGKFVLEIIRGDKNGFPS